MDNSNIPVKAIDLTTSECNGNPKFFTKDILAILDQKNALKERVIELEEEVIMLRMEVSRLSNFGTLTLNPNILKLRRSRAGAICEVEATDRRDLPAPAFFEKPLKSYEETQVYVTDVVVTGYKKKNRNYVYVIEVTWSDGQRFEIYRRYGQFFTYQNTLLQLFPEESGRTKRRYSIDSGRVKRRSVMRIIPSLPTIDNVLSLFGRTNSESIIKARLATINEYCQVLLLHLESQISRSPYVLNFFRPTIGDIQHSKLKRKENSVMNLSILSVYPQNIPAGSIFEEYVVLADYDGNAAGEISANAGDRVKVIKKEESGWWLVSKPAAAHESCKRNEEEIGYISREYLKAHQEYEQCKMGECFSDKEMDMEEITSEELKYEAIEDYHTDDPRQLSMEKEEVILVIEKSEDGWWLAVREGKQGWVPGSYLTPFAGEMKEGTEDQEVHQDDHKENSIVALEQEARGENYIAIDDYKGEQVEDISFPKGATVEVLENNINGWWLIRYEGRIGVAPASFLALLSSPVVCDSVTPTEMSMDMGHCISGIKDPPPRSEIFRNSTRRKILQRSLNNTPVESVEQTTKLDTDDCMRGPSDHTRGPSDHMRGPSDHMRGGLSDSSRGHQSLLGLKLKSLMRSPKKRPGNQDSKTSLLKPPKT